MISSSQQQVEDPRFAELLRPIKDLTANFNIPLSQFLDIYYSDLRDGFSGLSSTPMDSQSKVNFAQAGLLLQGTASVYSKKVEFLWQNVLEMLEFLSQRQSRQERSENDAILGDGEDENASGRRKGASKLSKKEDFLTGDFLPLPIELSHRTLIKDLNGLNHRSINFIAITPCQLIQKEGKETAPLHTRVNIYSKSVQSEILGPKDDFRVNSQYCSVTGVIGQSILVPTNLPDLSISLCPNDKEDSNLPPPPSPEESVNESHHLEEEAAALVDDAPECIASVEQGDVPDQEPVDECDRLRRSKRQRIEESVLGPKKHKLVSADIWEPLKSNDAPTNTKNSIKIRRSTLLNRSSQSATKKNHSHLSKKTLSEYFNSVKHAAHRPKREALMNIPPELTEEAFEEEKRRKSMTKRLNQLKNNCPDALEEVEDSPGDENDEELPQNWDECAAVDPHEPMPLPMNPPSPSLISEATALNSYEELVVKNVGTYVAQSQKYIESTDMSKRVAAWHEHIRPKLEAVEARGAFNIHAYGTKVIDAFPNDNRKSTLPFCSVVEGMEKEEVSRYFLSCLMLANTSNLDLESNGMNHLNLTLLSKKRHHEELMASQEEPVLSSSKGRKRVMSSSTAAIVDEHQHQEIMQELDEIPDA